MVGGGPFSLAAGQWTDDTSMALCLADSLVDRQGFDPLDQMERYVRWYGEGYLSSTGRCFDIGHTVQTALIRFERTGEAYSGSTDPRSAGNGSLMRLAPAVLAYAHRPELAIRLAGESSKTTHGALNAVDACRYFAAMLLGGLSGARKDEILAPHYTPVPDLWRQEPLSPDIRALAAGSFRVKEPPEVRGTGYVVESLEAALWAFNKSRSFEEGALLAVNLGDDADTTGAVYGQLAGVYYGASGIPERWIGKLALKDRIVQLADGLLALRENASLRES